MSDSLKMQFNKICYFSKSVSYVLSRAIRIFFRIPLKQAYKGFEISLTPEHKLPYYQAKYASYDKFLPHLVGYLGEKVSVIDVGANCGDTLAAMIEANIKPTYICIEPDNNFYNYLLRNILSIKSKKNISEIFPYQALINSTFKSASLKGNNGTKHAVYSDSRGTYQSRSLDSIVSEFSLNDVKLIKVDVDGFDYDVLNSAKKSIIDQKPIIFFECQYDSEDQRDGYKTTITWLDSVGYNTWVIFDNFGSIILKTDNLEVVFQMIDYVWKQNKKSTARTIYYFDILCITKADSLLMENILKKYPY